MRRSVLCLAVLVVLQLSARADALQLKKKDATTADDDDGVDRYSHIRVKPRETFIASGLLTAAATALQVTKPAWVQNAFGACESGASAALYSVVKCVDDLKTSNPLGLTMGHGLLLKAIAEVLAQVIPQAGSSLAWLDPLRIVRSTIASLVSSSLTFYYWTRLPWVRAIKAPSWLAFLLGKTFGTTIAKTAVTQAVYRPANVFLFLLAQAFFRGDNARALVKTLRNKFKGGLIGGVAFFTVSNLIMFSIPVPFLHPIIGAIAGLIFNVWLAMVAYRKDPEPAAAAPDAASALQLSPLTALADSPVAQFPVTASLLGTVGLLETLAAASLYARQPTLSTKATDTMSVPVTPATASMLS